MSSPDFWQNLYASGGDGWELRAPAPPLVQFVETTPPPRPGVSVPRRLGQEWMVLARRTGNPA